MRHLSLAWAVMATALLSVIATHQAVAKAPDRPKLPCASSGADVTSVGRGAVFQQKDKLQMADQAVSVAATSFDKNTIITDLQLVEYDAMSEEDIQAFLTAHGSPLAGYSTGGRTAAQIIYDECQNDGISPHLVLTTLEKEMSLITHRAADPNYCAMGWNSCKPFHGQSVNDFIDQIHRGTLQFRLFLHNPGDYYDDKGNPWDVNVLRYVVDGTVTPTTMATASLYSYTNHIGSATGIGANYSFWNLWYNTFNFGSGAPPSPDPDVTALADTTQTVQWSYIDVGGKWYIVSPSGFFSSDASVLLLSSVDLAFPGKLRWKPINNYDTYAGFPAAATQFSYVNLSFDGGSVSFGDLLTATSDPDVSALANTTQTVSWYYIDPSRWYLVRATSAFSSDASVFLLDLIDPDFPGGIRWKPISNANEYGGFPAVPANFSYVTPSFDGTSIYFGDLTTAAGGNAQPPSSLYSAGGARAAQPSGLSRHTRGDVKSVGEDSNRTVANGLPGASCFALNTNANPPTAGTATAVTAQNCFGGYTSGTEVSITSSSQSGYQFLNWSSANCALSNASSSATVCRITGNGSATVTANFSPTSIGHFARHRAVLHP
jgi:hypothetical protein